MSIVEKLLKKLVIVKDDLRQMYKEDVTLLHRGHSIQNSTIDELQSKLYEVIKTSTQPMGDEKNDNQASTKPDFILKDEATWPELNELNDQLSNKDVGKKTIMRRLKMREKQLEKAILRLESAKTPRRATKNLDASASSSTAAEEVDLEQAIGNSFRCSVCTDIPVEMVLTDCGHVFCEGCYAEWEETRKPQPPTCPNCRNCPVQCLSADVITKFLENCSTIIPASPTLGSWRKKREAFKASNSDTPPKRRRLNECVRCKAQAVTGSMDPNPNPLVLHLSSNISDSNSTSDTDSLESPNSPVTNFVVDFLDLADSDTDDDDDDDGE